ncbi:hypothetical protein HDU97_010146 [Phlyctochytrium planicorne]|nr:hypothetical protein HDU97_010146 [Phlyctochytrium planicorne]
MSLNQTLTNAGGISSLFEDYLTLFYLVDPRKHVFPTLAEVPNYITAAYPFFILHIIIETLVVYMAYARDVEEQKQKLAGEESSSSSSSSTETSSVAVKGIHKKPSRPPRLNDAIGSISAGMTQQVLKVFSKSFELSMFVYVYEHFRIATVDPASPWVWAVAFFGVDLCYYLFHRGAHEVNLFWATHVVHHSSEDYNQTTALRQSAFQDYVSWAYKLPLALLLPPPLFAVHSNFNTLFQFWIHTETIPKLGFLEYFLNTPSAHRVHHGRNPYCIDKNYAGTLIIWDRLFGTYQEELETEPVLFGLTHNIHSFDPIWVQTHHFVHVFKTCWNTPGLYHKLAVLFAGPGWSPEKPHLRFGDLADIPSVPNLAQNPKADIGLYNPDIVMSGRGKTMAAFMGIYVLVQFTVTLLCQISLMHFQSTMSLMTKSIAAFHVIFSLWVLSLFLDGKKSSLALEIVRLGLIAPAVAYGIVTYAADPFSALPIGLQGLAILHSVASLVMLVGASILTTQNEKSKLE